MPPQPAENQDESPADSEDVADDFEDHADDADNESGDAGTDGQEDAEVVEGSEEEAAATEEAPAETPAAAKAVKDLTPEELTAQLPEDTLRRVALKFANKTMAAARRAEKSTGDVRASNEKLAGEVTTYRGFVDQMTSDPMTALRRLPNFTTLKDFVQRCVGSAGAAEPKPLDEIAALRKRLDDDKAERAAIKAAEAARVSQTRVFEALAEKPERWDVVLTRIGRAELWDSITEYTRINGRCPNAKVFELADKIEAELSKDVSATKKFAGPAQKGTPAAANARPAASNKGKPTGKPSASTPATRANDTEEDEDEREARILREMREAGELEG